MAPKSSSWTPEKKSARGNSPALLGSLLIGAQGYVAKQTTSYLTHDAWRGIAGERIARYTRVGKLYAGTLTVQVASSAWCHELSFLKEDILAKLTRAGHDVKKLRFVVDEQARDLSATEQNRKRRPWEREMASATKTELPESLLEKLALIDDENLRAAIHEAASRSLAPKPEAKSQPISATSPTARQTKSKSSSS